MYILYTGDIVITQVYVASSDSWIVEGVATYEYGGSNLKIFEFHCTSTSNNGNGLSWARKDASLTKSQSVITGGMSLDFNNPVAKDAGMVILMMMVQYLTLLLVNYFPLYFITLTEVSSFR